MGGGGVAEGGGEGDEGVCGTGEGVLVGREGGIRILGIMDGLYDEGVEQILKAWFFWLPL